MMAYDWVKKLYPDAPSEIGRRVRHKTRKMEGVITEEESSNQYLMVRFDGRKHSTECQPMSLEYIK